MREEGLPLQPRSLHRENQQRTHFRKRNERTLNHPAAYVLLDGPVALNERALVETLQQRRPWVILVS